MTGCSVSMILVIALFGAISAVQVNEPCGTRNAVTGFDLDSYLGVWYEMYRYPNDFQRESECVNTEVYVETNDVDMRMLNQMVAFEPDFVILNSTMLGRIAFPEAVPAVGAFNMSYTGVYDRTNFYILATDYEDYSIAWSCSDNDDNTSEQLAWVFSRYYYIRTGVEAAVNALIDQHLVRGLLRETFLDDHYCLGGEISPAK